MSSTPSPHLTEEDENYFVSMTDLMVGMLFIFIIILMAFALNFREAQETQVQKTQELVGATQELVGAKKTRDLMLVEIQKILEGRGVIVKIDRENGVLRFKADLLFEKGEAELSDAGRETIDHVAAALWKVLPCYSKSISKPQTCPPTKGGRLEAIFIEGHTDSDKFASGATGNNWKLSAGRAINTFEQIVKAQDGLKGIQNDDGLHLIGVSGYAENRPTIKEEGQTMEAKKQADRRIDLRFIMASPKLPEPADNIRKVLGEEQHQ